MKHNFTKQHTQIAKGMAILLMLIHHLFFYPSDFYVSLAKLGGQDIESYLSVFGKICVAMFLFLSGYGITVSSDKKEVSYRKLVVSRVINLMINYWIVFLLFVPIGFIITERNFEISEFIGNLFLVSSSYNSSWWFLRAYIELILLFPLLKKLISDNLLWSFSRISVVIAIGEILERVVDYAGLEILSNSLIFHDIIRLCLLQSCFLMGYVAVKFDLYAKCMEFLSNHKWNRKWFYVLVGILIVLARYLVGNKTILDYVFVPIWIVIVVNSISGSKLEKLFLLLGKHATNMWLVHVFLFEQYLQEVIFYPNYSALVVVNLVFCSLVCSYGIGIVSRLVYWGVDCVGVRRCCGKEG